MSEAPWSELGRALEGELSIAPGDREAHSEDASMYRLEPQAVAFPRHEADCRQLLAFCRAHSITLHPWGAGTSRGGQPLGTGLVVDFRRHMKRILGFDEGSGELRTEPGAYYSEVQKFLQARGRSFPPDPSYHQCTIGGMIANNAAGIRSVKYGGSSDSLAACRFLTSDGTLHDSRLPDTLSAGTRALLERHAPAIRAGFPRVEKNSSGYALALALEAPPPLFLARLLAGSEGSLALILEATLRTRPLPGARALGLLCFSGLEAALEAALLLRDASRPLPEALSACELVDKVLLDLHAAAGRIPGSPKHARPIEGNPFLERFYRLKAEALLIVETEGESAAGARSSLEALLAPLPALERRIAADATEERWIWDLRRHTSPILNRLEEGRVSIKPLWGVEDVSLPRDSFLEYVREQKRIFARHGLLCSFFGHAASCNLHIDPLSVDPRAARSDRELARLYDEVAAESYALVVRLGGSISGEHGDGLSRTPYLSLQYPALSPVFAELKTLFDPHAILNPGKVVPAPRRP